MLLASLVGGDPEDIEEIKFDYLDTTLSDKNKKQLDNLLEIEQKKQGLKIELTYHVDAQLQKEAIAKDLAGKLYFKETQKDYLKNEKDFETFILNKTASDSLNIIKSYMSLSDPTLLESMATSNTQSLISNTEEYLATAQDSTQIKVNISDPKAPENIGAISTLKVNFSMLDKNE